MKKRLVLRKEVREMLDNIFGIGIISFIVMLELIVILEIFIRYI